jgi:glycosyltransferase involved in cell wall biosynthesis
VLVVEDRAHRLRGHYPVRFAELAEGLVEAGARVEVLTSRGWAESPTAREEGFIVHQYGWFSTTLDSVTARLRRRKSKHPDSWSRTLHDAVRGITMTLAVKRLLRRSPEGPSAVVVLAYEVDPLVVAAIAGRGRWLLYQFSPPSEARRRAIVRPLASALTWAAKQAERRRRARGDGIRITTPCEEVREPWQQAAPFLAPLVLRIAGCRASNPCPAARQRLAIDSAERVALVFGASHPQKDLDVVWDAFLELQEWRLLIGGRAADAYARAEHAGTSRLASSARPPLLFAGRVDQTVRDLVHAAADLAILSFERDYYRESGTLMDAVAWGVPVVCSARSLAARIVREYRLGVLFEPGDPESLAAAVRRAPARIEPESLERARAELSNGTVALRHLEVIAALGRT